VVAWDSRTPRVHLIEQAYEEARGRVSGPNGASVRLGVAPSTLESKIRRLNIDRCRLRSAQEPQRHRRA